MPDFCHFFSLFGKRELQKSFQRYARRSLQEAMEVQSPWTLYITFYLLQGVSVPLLSSGVLLAHQGPEVLKRSLEVLPHLSFPDLSYELRGHIPPALFGPKYPNSAKKWLSVDK